jgi:hypothetical protein
MRLLRLIFTHAIALASAHRVLALTLAVLFTPAANGDTPTGTSWDQPAAALADQIAGILGPGQAHITLRNLSTISTEELPAIRRLLEQDLRAHGITPSTDEAANLLRVTLSENTRQRLWIAEVVEGNETKVVMVTSDLGHSPRTQPAAGVTLHKQLIVASREAVLAVLEVPAGLVVLEPERIVVYAHVPGGWNQQAAVAIRQKRPLARDARGILLGTNDGQGFEADLPGAQCDGTFNTAIPAGQWAIHCHESDDPWPIAAPFLMQIGGAPAPALKAFYNSTRDYFTGIVAPNLGVELPAFYTAAWLSHAQAPALLINGIDGKLQLVENVALKPIAGARDWGSDFAAVQSACGSGTQIVASGSGAAAQDSLRAYDIPALEAVPASAPLAMEGAVSALSTALGGRSAFATVRTSPSVGQPVEYEVDRVTATCN